MYPKSGNKVTVLSCCPDCLQEGRDVRGCRLLPEGEKETRPCKTCKSNLKMEKFDPNNGTVICTICHMKIDEEPDYIFECEDCRLGCHLGCFFKTSTADFNLNTRFVITLSEP